MNAFRLTLLAAVLALPVNALASAWSCSHGNNVREVWIDRPADAYVPCDVMYHKITEGAESTSLWNAQNDDSYCEEKASEFIAKLESWGWVCRETVRGDATGDDMSEDAVSEDTDSGSMTMPEITHDTVEETMDQ